MKSFRIFILSFSLIAAVYSCEAVSRPLLESPEERLNTNLSWKKAVGTHFLLYPEAFMGASRSWPTPSRACFTYDVSSVQPEGIDPSVGRFSRELRYYDWLGTVPRAPEVLLKKYGEGYPPRVRNEAHDLARHIREAAAAGIDLDWNVGEINHGNSGLIEHVMDRNGAYFKDALYELFRFAHTGEFENLPIKIYWEIGNEINSERRFSLENRPLKKGATGVAAHLNIIEHAQDYLEYYLAPVVEALRTASAEILGDPHAVQLFCGSLTWPRSPHTLAFLRIILQGTVRGDHAPSLSGKNGYQLVDSIAVHYTLANHVVMDTYYDEWVASGKVRSLWNTEELGAKGRGDYMVALLSFRYLSYWLDRDWDPDRARMIFYGDRMERPGISTRGDQMQLHLGRFFRNDSLFRIPPSEVEMNVQGPVEVDSPIHKVFRRRGAVHRVRNV
jgi:hypothetical protein